MMVFEPDMHVPIAREADGTYTASYGPYQLKTAFQPIFSQNAHGALRLEGFEGLIRPFLAGAPCSPARFFPAVPAEDGARVDRLCRELHIRNLPATRRGDALLFVNLDPGRLSDLAAAEAEIERLAASVRQAGLAPDRIVCEITEKSVERQAIVAQLAEALRRRGLRIAVDDYGAEQSDAERLRLVRPDIVKFDAHWIARFMDNAAGVELLRTLIGRFRDQGIATLFEGLEALWQVEICQEIGVGYMQGFVMARPQIVPTDFHLRFGDPAGRIDAAAPRPGGDPPPSILPPSEPNPIFYPAPGGEDARDAECRNAAFGENAQPPPPADATARPAGPTPGLSRPVFGRRRRAGSMS